MYTTKTSCTIPVSRAMKRGIYYTVSISSTNTDKQTADSDAAASFKSQTDQEFILTNENNLMGQFLLMLHAKLSYGLLELSGCSDNTSGLQTSKATLIIAAKDMEKANEFVFKFQKEYLTAYHMPFQIQFIADDDEEIELVLDDYSQDRTITFLSCMPQKMPSLPDNFQTHTGAFLILTRMYLENETLQIQISLQCNSAFTHDYMSAKVCQLTEMMGGSVRKIEQ